MASTIMPSSNKHEITVFDTKKPKSSTSVRRLFHILKHTAFKNRQNDVDSLKTKANDDYVPCTPEHSTTEDEPDVPGAEAENPKDPTGSTFPSSTAIPKTKPTPTEPLHHILTPVLEDIASPNVPEAFSPSSSPPSVLVHKSSRTKPSKSRQPRKPTMITPELMQQIQASNRKRHGSQLLNGGELRTKALGTATATSRAKEVLASPLRWSEQ